MTDCSFTRAAPRRQMRPDPAFSLALWILAGVSFLRVAWLAGQPIDLYPDEAQYWIWAQHPAFGYFSKPPMIAWMIWLTTHLFGDSFLAVKIAAPLTYCFTGMIVHAIARRLFGARTGLWAAAAFITLPSVSLSAIIISTDVPLLFFWAAATYGLIRAREESAWRGWWAIIGLCVGLGLLSKYAMGFWLLSVLLFLLAWREERRHLRYFGLAVLLALAIASPNVFWNLHHHFATLHATQSNVAFQGMIPHPAALLAFAAAQFGVFGPVFMAVLILILVQARRVVIDRRFALLLMICVPTLAIMLGEATISRAQPNWSAPAYVSATILVVAWLELKGRSVWVEWSVVFHIVLAILLLGASDIAHLTGHPLPGRLDPLHRVKGWSTLGRSVSTLRAESPKLPLLGDERELVSGLIYAMHPHPFDIRIWNPAGSVRNGLEMTQSLVNKPGGDYLWITNRIDKTEIFDRFDKHVELAHIIVPLGPAHKGRILGQDIDIPALTREVWVEGVFGFKGYAPPADASPAHASPANAAPEGDSANSSAEMER